MATVSLTLKFKLEIGDFTVCTLLCLYIHKWLYKKIFTRNYISCKNLDTFEGAWVELAQHCDIAAISATEAKYKKKKKIATI